MRMEASVHEPKRSGYRWMLSPKSKKSEAAASIPSFHPNTPVVDHEKTRRSLTGCSREGNAPIIDHGQLCHQLFAVIIRISFLQSPSNFKSADSSKPHRWPSHDLQLHQQASPFQISPASRHTIFTAMGCHWIEPRQELPLQTQPESCGGAG